MNTAPFKLGFSITKTNIILVTTVSTLAFSSLVLGGIYATSDYTIHRVIDGDTIEVSSIFGGKTTVRLLNINTPETKNPNKPVQCLGPEATEFLKRKLPAGSAVKLEYDIEKYDTYGRTLAGVYSNGSLINAEIAAEGLGLPILIEPNSKFYYQVLSASKDALNLKRGLFSESIECTLASQSSKNFQNKLLSAKAMTADETTNTKLIEDYKNHYYDILKEINRHKTKAITNNEIFSHSEVKLPVTYKSPFDFQEQSMKEKYEVELTKMTDEGKHLVEQRKAKEERLRKEAEAKAAREAAEKAERERQIREEQARLEAQRLQALQQQQQTWQSNENYQPATPDSTSQVIGGCYPHGVAPPGYHGKRCYRPGGKTWCVC